MERTIIAVTGLFILSNGLSEVSQAQTFVLHDTTSIEGEVVSSTNATLTILERNGAIVPLSIADIREVQLPVSGRDKELTGKIVGWDNGIFEIITERHTISIAGGRILSAKERQSGTGGPAVTGETASQSDDLSGSAQPSKRQPTM